MRINFCRSAYVRDIGDEMIDAARREITGYADGDQNYCVTYEDFTSALDELNDQTTTDVHDQKLRDFLNEIKDGLVDQGEIGDVVFCR